MVSPGDLDAPAPTPRSVHAAALLAALAVLASLRFVAVAPSVATHGPYLRMLGAMLVGIGCAALMRRGLEVDPSYVTTLPGHRVLDSLLFPPRLWGLGIGAAGAGAARAEGVPSSSIGAIAIGFAVSAVAALALALQPALVLIRDHYRIPELSRVIVPVGLLDLVLWLVASLLVLRGFVQASRSFQSSMRVRFEIGGLGTRIEDMTPLPQREIRPLFGFVLIAIGFGVAKYGGADLALLASFLAFAPGLALVGHAVSGLLLAFAWLVLTSFQAFGPDFAIAAITLLLALDSQQLAARDPGVAPRAVQIRFLVVVSALVVLARFLVPFALPKLGIELPSRLIEATLFQDVEYAVTRCAGDAGERWQFYGLLAALLGFGVWRPRWAARLAPILACLAIGAFTVSDLWLWLAGGAVVASLLRLRIASLEPRARVLDPALLTSGMLVVAIVLAIASALRD